MNEQMTMSAKKKPSSFDDLIPAILTRGATPVIPKPFDAAAIVPAVWVPWPAWSSHAASAETGAPLSHDTLRAKSMFPTRSG